jgi:hypothetical protein
MSSTFQLTLVCASGHSQKIQLGPGFTRAMAEDYAGLIDGTSDMFIASPLGTDSPIGKCCICGAQIRAQIEQVPCDPN